MASRSRSPALTLFESTRRPPLTPTAGAALSFALHAGLVAAIVAGTAVAREYTLDEQTRAAQFLMPLKQQTPRPLQQRVSYVGLASAVVAPPADKPTFTDKYVEKKAVVPTTETPVAEGEPLPQERAFSELEVDSAALRDPNSEGPVYPAALLEKGVEGHALVRFVVTAEGTVDLTSFAVILSTDSAFTKAARDVLPRMKFRPAWFAGRAVSQLVEQDFSFRIRKPG